MFQLLGKYGPDNQYFDLVRKNRFQLLRKFGPANQNYINLDVIFPLQSAETIVSVHPNDAPGIRSLRCLRSLTSAFGVFLGAPTLGPTRAGGHDDGS